MDTPEFVHYIKTTNKRNIDELISLAKENNIQYVSITRARLELIYDHEWTDEK